MPKNENVLNYDDRVWVEFNTPFNKKALLNFCQKLEQLYRINPYLEFEKWAHTSKYSYYMVAINHSQVPSFKIDTKFKLENLTNGIEVHYSNGIKSSTRFIIDDAAQGSKLIITEIYRLLPTQESLTYLHEVDKSLTKWAEEIQQYIILWDRWSWFTPWKLYKSYIWLPMKPSGRRITYMLLWISIIEVLLVSLGVMIYFIEYR